MKFKTPLVVLFFLVIQHSWAQSDLIVCSSQSNPDKSISIFADSKAFGEYTLKLSFSSTAGYSSNALMFGDFALLRVRFGKSEIIKFTPTLTGTSFGSYRWQYFPGVALTKTPDTSFAYLLPINTGKQLRIVKSGSVTELLRQKNAEDYNATGFEYKYADTICASRAGIVFACNDLSQESVSKNTAYRQQGNSISIQHKDETISTYRTLAPIQLLVSPGEYVYPGKPLAVFHKPSEKYILSLATYYLSERKLIEGKEKPYVYFPALFYTSETKQPAALKPAEIYSAEHPLEFVTSELTKKQKKSFGFK